MPNLTTAEYHAICRNLGVKPRAAEIFRRIIPRERSCLELRFLDLWRLAHGPELVEEYRFAPSRRWRFDFAHLPSKTAIEVEGGTRRGGRHNRHAGFVADAEKYAAATLAGWTVFRLPGPMVRLEWAAKIVGFMDRHVRIGKREQP